MGLSRRMSLSHTWYNVKHVRNRMLVRKGHYSECGGFSSLVELGYRNQVQALSLELSSLFTQVYTSFGSSSLKSVRWLYHLLKPGVPSRTPPPTEAHLRQLPDPAPGTSSFSPAPNSFPFPCCQEPWKAPAFHRDHTSRLEEEWEATKRQSSSKAD